MKIHALLAAFLFCVAMLSAQDVKLEGQSKADVVNTGANPTFNIHHKTEIIFGKSPEYAEIKKTLAALETDIQKKGDQCEQMAKDSLPAKYRDGCRGELIALNAKKDSVLKVETRFREDVIRLAETFSNIKINSERLRLAKKFFDDGKFREADAALNEKEMAATGDAALAVKIRNDSVLLQTANEFALKAQLKATQMEFDSAQILFEQSRRYFETVDNLSAFAALLCEQNQTPRAIEYYEKALKLARSESDKAILSMNLGICYAAVQKREDAEKMYLRSLVIQERLAKANPEEFEPDLGRTVMNLGTFYCVNQKMKDAEKMYLRSFEIFERLARASPSKFETELAAASMNLGIFYADVQKREDAEKMFLRSLEIQDRLSKANPAQFEPDLAMTAMNLGILYKAVQKIGDAETMFLRSLEIYVRLAKANPAQFEPELARMAMSLGVFYYAVQKMGDAETMFLHSLQIYWRLVEANPAEFEPDLAMTAMNLGICYAAVQKKEDAEKMFLRSLEIYERLVKANPTQFEPDLAATLNNYGVFLASNRQFSKAHSHYSRALFFRKKQMLGGLIHFREKLDNVCLNMAGLRDSFIIRENVTAAAAIQLERAACMDSLRQLDSAFLQNAVNGYGSLSWYCLFVGQFPESENAALRALTLDSSKNWVRSIHGHSHLLRGDWKKAKTIYSEYISNEEDPAEAKKMLLKDLDDLEAAGITCPEMAQARASLRE